MLLSVAIQQGIMLIPAVVSTVNTFAVAFAPLLNRSIENIVLCDEDNIEHQTDVGKAKLHRVTSQTTPIRLQGAVYEELKHAEHATAEVQQLLRYRPADGGLALEVGEDLRNVLPDREDELDVLDRVDLKCVSLVNHDECYRMNTYHVEPSPTRAIVAATSLAVQHDQNRDSNTGQAAEQNAERQPASVPFHRFVLIPSPELWPELRVDYYTEDPSMHAKGEVIEADCGLWRERVANSVL